MDAPATNAAGAYVGTAQCEAKYSHPRPPVPYGQQNVTDALWFEDGFKEVVGYLTEGRHLVFEKAGFALTNNGKASHVTFTPATADHSSPNQRWVIHYSSGEESQIFTISSALDGKWLGKGGALLPAKDSAQAVPVKLTFLGNGKGYTLQLVGGHGEIDIRENDGVSVNSALGSADGFKIWSVTYHN